MSGEGELTPEEVQNWLAKGGFPLEMQVARAFQRAGFSVVQSDFYKDPETEKQREIDLVAVREFGRKEDGDVLRMVVVVECKHLARDKGWVVFTERRRFDTSIGVTSQVSSGYGPKFLEAVAKRGDMRGTGLFSVGALGYSMAAARKPKKDSDRRDRQEKDSAYDALLGVAHAAASKASSWWTGITIVFPVLVTDGSLFECGLEEDKAVVAPASECFLVWKKPVGYHPLAGIRVVTLGALEELVRKATLTEGHFQELTGLARRLQAGEV